MDADALDLGEGLGVALGSARADDLDPVAGLGERAALLPDPPVERDGEVLDQDEDTTALAPATSRRRCNSSALRRPRTPGTRTRSTTTRSSTRPRAAIASGSAAPTTQTSAWSTTASAELAMSLREVRDAVVDVVAVGAEQARDGHVPVVDQQLVALADQPLDERDHRALAQVVGAGLERQPEHADPALARLLDQRRNAAVDLQLVRGQHAARGSAPRRRRRLARVQCSARRSFGRHEPPKAKPGFR